MDERIYQIAEQIVEIHQKAYEFYLPLVEDVCSGIVSEAELSHLLDYLLDFACDEKILGLYKKVSLAGANGMAVHAVHAKTTAISNFFPLFFIEPFLHAFIDFKF